jgi:hypothetical protein
MKEVSLEMVTLHFDFKDVFRAGRLGFSPKKMWMQFVGLGVGLVLYTIFGYVAFLLSGWDIGEIWTSYRLWPFPLYADLTWYSVILVAVGALLLLITNLLANTAVAKVTFEQLRGDEFYEIQEALRFVRRHWRVVLLSPLALLLFMAVLVIFCGLIPGAFLWIPFAGEWLTALAAIPLFAVFLFVVYLGIIFIVSLIMGPAIVATTESDTFDSIFELFSVVNDQPWRLVVYEVILAGIVWVAVYVLGAFVIGSLRLFSWAVTVWPFAADKAEAIIARAMWYLPYCPAIERLEWLPGVARSIEAFGPTRYAASPGWSWEIAALLGGIALYVVLLFVVSYGMAIASAGETLIYLVLYKKKDDRNLLERRDERELPEEAGIPEKQEAPEERTAEGTVEETAEEGAGPEKPQESG